MDSETKQRLLDLGVEAARRYLDADRRGRVGPTPDQVAALAGFGAVSLDEPIGPDAAIELLDRLGSPATMRSTGGRYFGFVNGGTTPEALAASILSTTWDQNAALPVMSPAASAIDAVTCEWIVELLGLPTDSTAAFCGGASIANLTAVVAARDELLRRAGWDCAEQGLVGAPPIRVVVSAETHVSALKALRVAGFGRAAITTVPADETGCLRADLLPPVEGPTLVLAQAGNVNTGHSDDFAAIADHLAGHDAWLHVDGAFGLWAGASPTRRHLVAGVEQADSWATDAHKWLNAPYDAGVVIVGDGDALRRSMSDGAAYLAATDSGRPLMNLGLQMSQAARAVPVWAILAAGGRAGIADIVNRTCEGAARFEQRLTEAGVEILAPVVLNQALARFGDDATTDAVIDRVQADGVCWVGPTTWQGRRAMRISVSDASTTTADVDASADSMLAAWRAVSAQG